MIFACNEPKAEKEAEKVLISLPPSDYNSLENPTVKTVIDFLSWYDKHYESLNNQLIINSNENSQLNDSVAKQFIIKLGSSGYLSENYLSDLKDYLKTIQKRLVEIDQSNDPTDGLEFDLILHSQDSREVLSQIELSTLEDYCSNGPDAHIKLGLVSGNKLTANLIYQKDKWLIDSLGFGSTNYR